jgi:hypothetical protein
MRLHKYNPDHAINTAEQCPSQKRFGDLPHRPFNSGNRVPRRTDSGLSVVASLPNVSGIMTN